MVAHVLSHRNYAYHHHFFLGGGGGGGGKHISGIFGYFYSQESVVAKLGQQFNLKRTSTRENQLNSIIIRRIRGFWFLKVVLDMDLLLESKTKRSNIINKNLQCLKPYKFLWKFCKISPLEILYFKKTFFQIDWKL